MHVSDRSRALQLTAFTSGKAFTGLVTGVAVWAIYGGGIFPGESDPKGAPETWTREELRRWLQAVSLS